MIPKKAKDYIKTQAEKERIPVEDMEIIILSYYKLMRDTLSSLKHLRVRFTGMGTMRIRINYLQKEIKKLEKNKEMHNWEKRMKLEPLQELDKKREEEWARRSMVKEMKDAYKRNHKKQNDTKGEVSESLGEQE